MIDQLVMLLSTDWFKPHWHTLDIDVEESAKTLIQRGCREIVGQIMSGTTNYYQISFAPDRIEATRSMLNSLVHASGVNNTLNVLIAYWDNLKRDDETASWIWNSLTSDILAGRLRPSKTDLDPLIVETLFAEHVTHDKEPFEFAPICEESPTEWDRYTRTLTPEQPTALADDLASKLTSRRFEEFWRTVQSKLNTKQQDELISWYRKLGKAQGRRDIVPSYLS